jgi:tetratricopeptide (TPR) repeat protein
MANRDRYGLPLSTTSAIAVERYQEGMDRLLAYGPEAEERFGGAATADPDFALAHAGVALCAFVRGDGPTARAALDRARERAAGGDRRERQHLEALGALLGGETARGLGLVDEHLKEFPRDALLVNQASSSIGFAGGADREEHRRAFVERLAPAYGDDWWYQSALAFTYHEVGRLDESRRLSERSLAQHPGNANASHNIAHVMFETASHDEGAAFLSEWLRDYDRRASFHCHLVWHLALFELQRGDSARSLQIFEQDMVGSSNARLTVIDGAALLWRFVLYGCPEAPLPWRPLAELAPSIARPGFVFGDIHVALVYAATGDHAALAKVIAGLEALDAKGHPVAGTVALPMVKGAAAFAAGDYTGTLDHLVPVAPEMHRVGGSHAQWELFEETIVAAYLRLGRNEDALSLLRRRLEHRSAPRDLAWLAQAEAAR